MNIFFLAGEVWPAPGDRRGDRPVHAGVRLARRGAGQDDPPQGEADKDMAQHKQEMKELQRIIDHDKKLREFMNEKGKEREEDDYLKNWRQKKGELTLTKPSYEKKKKKFSF